MKKREKNNEKNIRCSVSDHDKSNVGFTDFDSFKIQYPGIFEALSKTSHDSKCPNCGFDFKEIKPQEKLYTCKCGKYQAEITQNNIRIISDL